MEVTLTPELEALLKEKVQSGLYLDASDVVRDALRALDQNSARLLESSEFEALLLEAVEGPHHPLTEEVYARIMGQTHANP